MTLNRVCFNPVFFSLAIDKENEENDKLLQLAEENVFIGIAKEVFCPKDVPKGVLAISFIGLKDKYLIKYSTCFKIEKLTLDAAKNLTSFLNLAKHNEMEVSIKNDEEGTKWLIFEIKFDQKNARLSSYY